MIFCVDIRSVETGDTVETILETDDHQIAYETAERWNLHNHNKQAFFADVYNDETR